MDNEVAGITTVLTRRGIAVFVLKYRLVGLRSSRAAQDVLRAIRSSDRARPSSACGPIASACSARPPADTSRRLRPRYFDAPEGRTGAPLDTVSARPDFVALLYPVVTMKAPFAHADSRRNLLGDIAVGAR